MLYVCRSIFIALICGSLLLWDFSYKGIEVRKAHAEEISDSNLWATLTMAATGLIASRLWTYPKKTPDMMAAAVGGAAFIAGEIMAYMQFKDQLKDFEDDLVRDEKGKLTEKQIETLEKLLQSYEKAKETAGTKKKLQMAAAAAFAVAAGIAVFTTATDEASLTACKTAITAAQSAAASCVGAAGAETFCPGTPPPYGPCLAPKYALYQAACAKCAADVPAIMSNHLAVVMGRETPGPNMGFFTKVMTTKKTMDTLTGQACVGVPMTTAAVVAKAKAACPAANASTTIMEAGGGPQLTWFGKNQYSPMNHKSLTLFITSLLIPNSHASTFSSPLSMMGIASGAAVAFVMANYLGIANMVDMNLLIAKRRAMIWGAMALTTTMAISATTAVEQKLETNIQKIKAILSRMYDLDPKGFANKPNLVNSLKKGISGSKNKITSIPLSNSVGKDGTTKYDTVTTLPCITAGSSESGTTCPDMGGALQGIEGVNNLPTELRNQFNDVADFGKSINGATSISSAALEGAEKLGSQSNAIASRMRAERKKVQDLLNKKAPKDKQLDFDKAEADMQRAFFKSTEDSLRANKLSASDALKMMGSGVNGMTASAADYMTATGKTDAGEAPVIDLSAGTGDLFSGAGKAGDGDFDLGLDESEADKDIAGIEELNPVGAKNIDDYDLGQNIHKDPSANLFDIISKRYMSSGYKRLLERKKPAEKALK